MRLSLPTPLVPTRTRTHACPKDASRSAPTRLPCWSALSRDRLAVTLTIARRHRRQPALGSTSLSSLLPRHPSPTRTRTPPWRHRRTRGCAQALAVAGEGREQVRIREAVVLVRLKAWPPHRRPRRHPHPQPQPRPPPQHTESKNNRAN